MAEKKVQGSSARKQQGSSAEKTGEVKKKDGRGGARPHPEWQLKNMQDGDNSRYIQHSLRFWNLPKVSMADEVAVAQRVCEYFQICGEDNMKPSVAGLSLALDCDRTYLWEIREGRKGKNPEVANTLKKAMKLIESQTVTYMQDGKMNPIPAIFMLKNNFGYADEQKVVIEPSQPMGTISDDAELQKKYVEDIVTTGKTVEG